MQTFQSFNVLGTKISFRTESETSLIEEARDLVEKKYKDLTEKSGGRYGKDQMLSFLVLGIADELLETQQSLERVDKRLATLLGRMEEAI